MLSRPVNFLIGFQTNIPDLETIYTMKNGRKRAISRRWASKELTLGRGERYRANRCQVNYVFRNKEEDKKSIRDVYIYIYIYIYKKGVEEKCIFTSWLHRIFRQLRENRENRGLMEEWLREGWEDERFSILCLCWTGFLLLIHVTRLKGEVLASG